MEKKFRSIAKKAVKGCYSYTYILSFYPEYIQALGPEKAFSIFQQEKQKRLKELAAI